MSATSSVLHDPFDIGTVPCDGRYEYEPKIKAPHGNGGASTISNSFTEVSVPKQNNNPQRDGGYGEDFIDLYTDYADGAELPKEANEAVAINLVGSILNKNGVTISCGSVIYTLDVWQVILSGSGGGRGTLVNRALKLLDRVGVDIERKNAWGSKISLYQSFATKPYGLSVWGEFAEITATFKQNPQMEEAKAWITDRYDNLCLPKGVEYRTTGKKSDTPPVTFMCAPRVNILTTSSEAWFFSNLRTTDSTGGFIPRFMIERCGPKRVVPIPPPLDEKKAEALIALLLKIDTVRGVADLSLIERDYEAWYRATHERFITHPNSNLAEPFFNRHRGHVLKLALIYEVARTQRAIITPESWERAKAKGRQLENTLFDLLQTGMTEAGAEEMKVLTFIRQSGADGVCSSDLYRAFRKERMTRHEELLNLLRAERIAMFQRNSGGRPKQIFVGKAFATEHAKLFDKDVEVHSPESSLRY